MTANRFEMSGLAYADQRLRFYTEVVEGWKAEHDQASLCLQLEQTLRDVRNLLSDIFAVDTLAHQHVLADPSIHSEVTAAITSRLAGWLKMAVVGEVLAQVMERRGFEVEGVGAFRDALAEARAAINPNDELTPAMATARDAALAELAAGETDTWR